MVVIRKKEKTVKLKALASFNNLKKKQQDQGSYLRTTVFCFENIKLLK